MVLTPERIGISRALPQPSRGARLSVATPYDLCEETHTAGCTPHFVALTVNLLAPSVVTSNNSGNAGGIDMVYSKVFVATARGDASI